MALQIDKNVFDPSLLSFPDCDYILAHAGEQPLIALRELTTRENVATVRQWLERFYELQELEKATGQTWAGVDKVRETINTYLEIRKQWRKDSQVGAPKYPSLYAFDSRGNGHLGAPGSDSDRVKTYFDAEGNRLPFALNLTEGTATGQWKPSWVVKKVQEQAEEAAQAVQETDSTPSLIYPEGKNCIECGVRGCGHTETFKPESRSSFNAARGRISKHLRNAKTEKEVHLELYSLEFGQVNA